jgi:hypothetical protein
MTAATLVAHLREQGIEVTLVGTQLACRPRGRLSPADREQVIRLKPALVQHLAQQRLAWEIFLLAESLGFPWVRIRPGVAVAGDRAGWALFLLEPPEPEDLLRVYTTVLDGTRSSR